MKLKYFLLTLFLLSSVTLFGQVRSSKQIHIGESVPDIELSNFLNDANYRPKISELYTHKILILDFWATWCGSCIDELRQLDSLKKVFGKRLEVVAVGYEDRKAIQQFFKLHPEATPKNVKILTNDTLLTDYWFPHRGLPHIAWIDSTGKVFGITGENDVNKNNLNKILNKGTAKLKEKSDEMDFDYRKPFHLSDTAFRGRSLLTKHTPGILSYDAGLGPGDGFLDRIFVANQSIKMLYWIAAFRHEITFGNYDRMVLETNDSLKYMEPKFAPESYKKSIYYQEGTLKSNLWEEKNLYCYDLTVPVPKFDTVMYTYMIEDLNRFLNLHGRFEIRSKECFVLSYKKHHENRLNESTAQQKIVFKVKRPIPILDLPVQLNGEKISTLLLYLNMCVKQDQIVDGTGIKPDRRFDFNLQGLKKGLTATEINEMLKPYGLFLTRKTRKVRLFVISEN